MGCSQHETGGDRPRAGLGYASSWLHSTTQLEVWIITQRTQCAHAVCDLMCEERLRGRDSAWHRPGLTHAHAEGFSTLEELVSGSKECLYREPSRSAASREP